MGAQTADSSSPGWQEGTGCTMQTSLSTEAAKARLRRASSQRDELAMQQKGACTGAEGSRTEKLVAAEGMPAKACRERERGCVLRKMKKAKSQKDGKNVEKI